MGGGASYFFGVQVLEAVSRHVLCETHGRVPETDGVLDYVFELVFGVARAELARVGVHCESHGYFTSMLSLT